MNEEEVRDEMDIKKAQAKKEVHKAEKNIKKLISDDDGQIYMNSWFGFIILLIIILVILRVFGLI